MSELRSETAVPHAGLGFREFVALIAAAMALNAVSIDSMLPALPAIGRSLAILQENHRQWIIAAYLLGFGVAQLIYGPISDRYGRRPVLLAGFAAYTLCSVAAAFATGFIPMIAARILQGVAAAATRVIGVSIVRDCYSGRQMARVMSLAFIVFLTVPILAPSIGQLILLVAPWRWIFIVLALFGATTGIWAALRLPETLHPEYRMTIAPRRIADAARTILGNRYSLGYTLASTLMFGALMAFIHSVQQIFADVFHATAMFAVAFALMAATMGFAAFANSRLVERLGMRLLSHGALLGFLGFTVVHMLVAVCGFETIWSFGVLQAGTMACFALASSNFGAIAMEPLGAIAGTASSVQGFLSSVGGTLIGIAIGQQFDGSTVPLTMGMVVLGLLVLVTVLVTERGQLFRPPALIARPAA